MKVWLSDEGDASVGIPGNAVYIDWNVLYPQNQKSREEERVHFLKLFKEYFDASGRMECVFDDECSRCGAVVGEGMTCMDCRKSDMLEAL
jgi:hypothetical protein